MIIQRIWCVGNKKVKQSVRVAENYAEKREQKEENTNPERVKQNTNPENAKQNANLENEKKEDKFFYNNYI